MARSVLLPCRMDSRDGYIVNKSSFFTFRGRRARVAWLMSVAALFSAAAVGAPRLDAEPPVNLRAALAQATGVPSDAAPAAVDGCSGCCSSHGGVSGSCSGNGHVFCNDGSVSPSCLCSSCGVYTPPPPPTCSGGQIWNGSACVCPSGEVYLNGLCTIPMQTCSGGQILSGGFCVCPQGQALVNGQCRATTGFTIGPGISGSWYEPDQSGHGFMLEVLSSPAGSMPV